MEMQHVVDNFHPCGLPNLPYLVIQNLFGMLDLNSKRTLRRVSHRCRELIDAMGGINLCLEVSDLTLPYLLKFRHFETLQFYPFPERKLHRLEVTQLQKPFKLSSTSWTRCPLPQPIDTLSFMERHAVSEANFLLLMQIYGSYGSVRKLVVDVNCLQNGGSRKAFKSIAKLRLNTVAELELLYTQNMDRLDMNFTFSTNITLRRVLLQANFPSLRKFKYEYIGFMDDTKYYNQLMHFITRHVKHLDNLEVAHPPIYPVVLLPPGETIFSVEERAQILKQFTDSSNLKEMSMFIPSFSQFIDPQHQIDLDLRLLNYQQNLTSLKLAYSREISPDVLNLGRMLRNCGKTLRVLKLQFLGWNTDPDPHFDLEFLEKCKFLTTLELTGTYDADLRNMHLLPRTLKHLKFSPKMTDADISTIMQLRMLETLQLWPINEIKVTLAQIQAFLGEEGPPKIQEITMCICGCEFNEIQEWLGPAGRILKNGKRVLNKKWARQQQNYEHEALFSEFGIIKLSIIPVGGD